MTHSWIIREGLHMVFSAELIQRYLTVEDLLSLMQISPWLTHAVGPYVVTQFWWTFRSHGYVCNIKPKPPSSSSYPVSSKSTHMVLRYGNVFIPLPTEPFCIPDSILHLTLDVPVSKPMSTFLPSGLTYLDVSKVWGTADSFADFSHLTGLKYLVLGSFHNTKTVVLPTSLITLRAYAIHVPQNLTVLRQLSITHLEQEFDTLPSYLVIVNCTFCSQRYVGWPLLKVLIVHNYSADTFLPCPCMEVIHLAQLTRFESGSFFGRFPPTLHSFAIFTTPLPIMRKVVQALADMELPASVQHVDVPICKNFASLKKLRSVRLWAVTPSDRLPESVKTVKLSHRFENHDWLSVPPIPASTQHLDMRVSYTTMTQLPANLTVLVWAVRDTSLVELPNTLLAICLGVKSITDKKLFAVIPKLPPRLVWFELHEEYFETFRIDRWLSVLPESLCFLILPHAVEINLALVPSGITHLAMHNAPKMPQHLASLQELYVSKRDYQPPKRHDGQAVHLLQYCPSLSCEFEMYMRPYAITSDSYTPLARNIFASRRNENKQLI